MGDEQEAERRRADLAPFQVDADLLAAAKDSAIVLHCLPAHPGEEISAEVLYGEPLCRLGPGREPPPRPEGAARHAAGRLEAPPMYPAHPPRPAHPPDLRADVRTSPSSPPAR